jgi:hypothetical protein
LLTITERDPKLDPQPGDIFERVRKCNDCTRRYRREVIQRTGPHTGTGHEWVVCRNGSGHNAYMLGAFLRWVEHAEVIHAA